MFNGTTFHNHKNNKMSSDRAVPDVNDLAPSRGVFEVGQFNGVTTTEITSACLTLVLSLLINYGSIKRHIVD